MIERFARMAELTAGVARVAGRFPLAIVFMLTGCMSPGPASGPAKKWYLLAVFVMTVLSCWLTHRVVDRFWRLPNADQPLIKGLPRSPWWLPAPFAWDWTLASSLSLFKFVAGVMWFLSWLWFFGLLSD